MRWLLLLILLKPLAALACLPNEVHIREQWINSYTKEDGTKVFAHPRKGSLRLGILLKKIKLISN